jgi:SpoVK/Ycf46/Vps4 family AAA+-type ATPase
VESKPTPRPQVVQSNLPRHAYGPSPRNDKENDLDQTINPQKVVPGDRVKIISSDREGKAMYVGTAKFAPGKTVVGIQLDSKRSSSMCDGKYRGERHFRCAGGYGVYTLEDEVEKIAGGDGDKAPKVEDLPPAEELALDKALSELVGLEPVKAHLKSVRNWVTVQRRREQVGVLNCKPIHFLFAGNRGTGMTCIARLLAHMLRDLRVIETGQYIEVTPKDLLNAAHTGDADKRVAEWIERAKGGLLMIDDAHLLRQSDSRSREQAATEAMMSITKAMEKNLDSTKQVWPQPFVVIFSGQRAEMNALIANNNALERLCTNQIEFTDFSVDELVQLTRRVAQKKKFTIAREVTDAKLSACVRRVLSRGGVDAKNLRQVSCLLDEAIARQTDRVFDEGVMCKEGLTKLTEKDFNGDGELPKELNDPAEEALKQLNNIVGLDGVKNFVRSLYAQLKTEQQRREAGMGSSGLGALHMIFSGNPGTGKTTVARIVATLLQKMGILRTGHLVETDRSSLVAGYCGQTALKTRAVVESAIGGVLFIDEAYALVQGDRDSFGTEALDTLIRLVEDHRGDLVCIMAGYRNEMAELVARNPGLQSRFPTTIEFPDYTQEQLMQIGERMLLQDCMMLSIDGAPRLQKMLQKAMLAAKSGGIGNGRAVRNLLEKAKRRQALRLQNTPGKKGKDDLCQLTAADFDDKDLESLFIAKKGAPPAMHTMMAQEQQMQNR